MAVFKIHKPNGPELHNQFSPVYQTLKAGWASTNDLLDFSGVSFLSPLMLLPLVAMVHDSKCQIILPTDVSVKSYLYTVSFPAGISNVAPLLGRSYIPIGKLDINDPEGAQKLLDRFEELVLGQLGQLPQGGSSAIRYPIAEISTNIFDHSKREVGWIFGQYYSSKRYLDICILDRGRGFARCYAEELGIEVDDGTAIRMALEGKSSKKSDERGFGLWTTKRVVVEGMGGQCFILSGSSGYIASPNLETSFGLDGVDWPGVIVAFRIPNISEPIDIYPYVS